MTAALVLFNTFLSEFNIFYLTDHIFESLPSSFNALKFGHSVTGKQTRLLEIFAMPGREVQGQVLLFGPEITEWSEAQLRNLHANITSNGRLESLVTCLRELPDSLLWHTANEGRADWSTSAATAARRLSDFILGDFSHLSPTSGNAVLAPLTVVEHAIKFIELIGEHNQLDDRAEIVFPPIAATQGFCVGFLSSIAISTSKDWTQLTQNLCKAVRLAVCIGATVDGQSLPETSQSCGATSKSFSVRWKSSSEKAFMDACIRDLPPVSFIHFDKDTEI